MGLLIQSLEDLSPSAKRDYFIYVLDYGWQIPLVDVLKRNFHNLAKRSSDNNSAIIMGVGELGHFSNEVLSYHSINGEDATDLLPALLVTRTNPHVFKQYSDMGRGKIDEDFSFVLVPLAKYCKSENDVVRLVDMIFSDIKSGKPLSNFSVQKLMKPGV